MTKEELGKLKVGDKIVYAPSGEVYYIMGICRDIVQAARLIGIGDPSYWRLSSFPSPPLSSIAKSRGYEDISIGD